MLVLLQGAAIAQIATPPESRVGLIQKKLHDLLDPVGVFVNADSALPKPGNAREFHLRWQKLAGVRGAASERRLSVVSASGVGRVPRERSLELTPGTLLVAAVDISGKLRAWRTITDPRFLRSEAPGPDGVLTGITVENPSPDFHVALADDPEIVELRFYEPRNTDGKISLQIVETVRVQ